MLIENFAILSLNYTPNKFIFNPKSAESDSEAEVAKDLFSPWVGHKFYWKDVDKVNWKIQSISKYLKKTAHRVSMHHSLSWNEHSAFTMIHGPSPDAHTSFDPDVSTGIKCLRLSQRKNAK